MCSGERVGKRRKINFWGNFFLEKVMILVNAQVKELGKEGKLIFGVIFFQKIDDFNCSGKSGEKRRTTPILRWFYQLVNIKMNEKLGSMFRLQFQKIQR